MKFRSLSLLILAAASVSCSVESGTVETVSYKRYFDALMRSRGYDQAPKTPLGTYVLVDEPGTGPAIGYEKDTLYVNADFTRRYFDGEVVLTTDDSLSRILGLFDTTYFYGPRIIPLLKGKEFAGMIDAFRDMNVGGYRRVVVPGWLMTTDVYETAQEYQDNCSGTEAMYDLHPVEVIDNIKKWEIDSLCRFVIHHFNGTVEPSDTVDNTNNKYGFYYKRTAEPESETSMLKDTVIYINYTCYTLDGRVIDTTNERIAKAAGFDVSSGSYSPVYIQMKEDYTSITMGSSGSSAISGFTFALSKMHPFESGTAVFYSGYGYSSTGSGLRIPPYASLRFDIDVVAKP